MGSGRGAAGDGGHCASRADSSASGAGGEPSLHLRFFAEPVVAPAARQRAPGGRSGRGAKWQGARRQTGQEGERARELGGWGGGRDGGRRGGGGAFTRPALASRRRRSPRRSVTRRVVGRPSFGAVLRTGLGPLTLERRHHLQNGLSQSFQNISNGTIRRGRDHSARCGGKASIHSAPSREALVTMSRYAPGAPKRGPARSGGRAATGLGAVCGRKLQCGRRSAPGRVRRRRRAIAERTNRSALPLRRFLVTVGAAASQSSARSCASRGPYPTPYSRGHYCKHVSVEASPKRSQSTFVF